MRSSVLLLFFGTLVFAQGDDDVSLDFRMGNSEVLPFKGERSASAVVIKRLPATDQPDGSGGRAAVPSGQ